MSNPLDPTIKENWQYHDEYEFWYMPYPGTNEVQAEEGVRWRGFKPWEEAPKQESSSTILSDNWQPIDSVDENAVDRMMGAAYKFRCDDYKRTKTNDIPTISRQEMTAAFKSLLTHFKIASVKGGDSK